MPQKKKVQSLKLSAIKKPTCLLHCISPGRLFYRFITVAINALPFFKQYSFASLHYASLRFICFAAFRYASAPFALLILYSFQPNTPATGNHSGQSKQQQPFFITCFQNKRKSQRNKKGSFENPKIYGQQLSTAMSNNSGQSRRKNLLRILCSIKNKPYFFGHLLQWFTNQQFFEKLRFSGHSSSGLRGKTTPGRIRSSPCLSWFAFASLPSCRLLLRFRSSSAQPFCRAARTVYKIRNFLSAPMLTLRPIAALAQKPGVAKKKIATLMQACRTFFLRSHVELRPSLFCLVYSSKKINVRQKKLPASPRYRNSQDGEQANNLCNGKKKNNLFKKKKSDEKKE
jgi:hypothetical protein